MLIAQTQENKFMYSITMHIVCYLNWMSFEQSVRPQSQILSVLLKDGWMTMSQTMTSPYPTTSYFNWTGIDMGVLNEFFASCWNTVEQPLSEDHYHCTDLPIYEITPEEVFTLINKLDINKIHGPDCLHAESNSW